MSMEPFTKIVWFKGVDVKVWSEKLNRARRLYHLTEQATFELGLRRVITYHVFPENIEEHLCYIHNGKYTFIPIARSKVYEGFSHRHIPPGPRDRYYVYGVLAHSREDAELFAEASNGKVDHSVLGELLGYPKCCIDFFARYWAKNGIVDPIYEAYGSEAKVHPFCNQALRYFGLRITPHLCCSPDCQETIKMGQKWYDIMRKIDPEGASALLEFLSMPFEWSCLNGAAIIDTELFRGITNSNMVSEKVTVKNLGWK